MTVGRVEAALKTEISRLARKEVRPLAKKSAEEFRRLSRKLSIVLAELAAIKRRQNVETSERRLAHVAEGATPESVGKARLSPRLIKKRRARLNVSQPELAELLGVSPAAVAFWESGKARPRPEMRAKIIGLRQLGRRDARRLLTQKAKRKRSAH